MKGDVRGGNKQEKTLALTQYMAVGGAWKLGVSPRGNLQHVGEGHASIQDGDAMGQLGRAVPGRHEEDGAPELESDFDRPPTVRRTLNASNSREEGCFCRAQEQSADKLACKSVRCGLARRYHPPVHSVRFVELSLAGRCERGLYHIAIMEQRYNEGRTLVSRMLEGSWNKM